MRQRLTVLSALAVLAAAALLRLWHLDNIPGVNGDEAYYGVTSRDIIRGRLQGWLTPNGNLINPFFVLPTILLSLLAPPSVVALRTVALLSGLLALAVNARLCRSVFGGPTALATTVMLAVLPENIAQSRFGWDPSQCLLADCFVIYFSLRMLSDPDRAGKWALASSAALFAALLVHPTNIFVAPFLLLACVLRWPQQVKALYVPRGVSLPSLGAYGLTILAGWGLWHHFRSVIGLRLDPVFPAEYGRLFSGVSLYQYIPGSFMPQDTPRWLFEIATVGPVIGVALLLLHALNLLRRWRTVSGPDRLIFLGWLACTLAFWVIAGAWALHTGVERYDLCLILPGTLAACRAAVRLGEPRPQFRLLAGAVGGGALRHFAGRVRPFLFPHDPDDGRSVGGDLSDRAGGTEGRSLASDPHRRPGQYAPRDRQRRILELLSAPLPGWRRPADAGD